MISDTDLLSSFSLFGYDQVLCQGTNGQECNNGSHVDGHLVCHLGLLFAEGFGFIWDGTEKSWATLLHSSIVRLDLRPHLQFQDQSNWRGTRLTHTYVPLHRASTALTDYVLISVYVGALHLFVGYIIGFYNVTKGHGIVAAFFEKGSWMMILGGGFMHIYGFMKGSHDVISGTLPAYIMIVGVLILIVALAVYEGFGWAGGIIMGPIETFGLLANTLSYLRVMAVGVAGVKIAEIGNNMGFASMTDAVAAGDYLLVPLLPHLDRRPSLCHCIGLLSPSIHAARLHFVEWMGKFYDGSGRVFSPLGGQPLHVEGKA